jgi:hypothetical protein
MESGETYTQINISNLSSGVYFVKISSATGVQTKVKKFVKM